MAEAYDIPVIPHAGQLHNYHLVMSHLNSLLAEYFPSPAGGGALDDDTVFWELFVGEPEAVGGYITLPERPGLGWTLREDAIRRWS